MSEEPEITVSPYPIAVETSQGTYTLLDPEGEPSGPRVQMPDGRVTALNADGGTLAGLSPEDHATLQAAVPASA